MSKFISKVLNRLLNEEDTHSSAKYPVLKNPLPIENGRLAYNKFTLDQTNAFNDWSKNASKEEMQNFINYHREKSGLTDTSEPPANNTQPQVNKQESPLMTTMRNNIPNQVNQLTSQVISKNNPVQNTNNSQSKPYDSTVRLNPKDGTPIKRDTSEQKIQINKAMNNDPDGAANVGTNTPEKQRAIDVLSNNPDKALNDNENYRDYLDIVNYVLKEDEYANRTIQNAIMSSIEDSDGIYRDDMHIAPPENYELKKKYEYDFPGLNKINNENFGFFNLTKHLSEGNAKLMQQEADKINNIRKSTGGEDSQLITSPDGKGWIAVTKNGKRIPVNNDGTPRTNTNISSPAPQARPQVQPQPIPQAQPAPQVNQTPQVSGQSTSTNNTTYQAPQTVNRSIDLNQEGQPRQQSQQYIPGAPQKVQPRYSDTTPIRTIDSSKENIFGSYESPYKNAQPQRQPSTSGGGAATTWEEQPRQRQAPSPQSIPTKVNQDNRFTDLNKKSAPAGAGATTWEDSPKENNTPQEEPKQNDQSSKPATGGGSDKITW